MFLLKPGNLFVSPKPSQSLVPKTSACSPPCSSTSFSRYVDPLPAVCGRTRPISSQILGYLHPLELLQVSRANKAFRELLYAPITDLTWRNSFLVENDPDSLGTDADNPDSSPYQIPLCPPHMSGRRWARLLFGPQICQVSGVLMQHFPFIHHNTNRNADNLIRKLTTSSSALSAFLAWRKSASNSRLPGLLDQTLNHLSIQP
jgi:hypothetical protein